MTHIADFKLTKLTSLFFNVAACIIFLAGYLIFLWSVISDPSGTLARLMLENSSPAVTLAVIGVAIVSHELLHALAYRLFGGKVRFGIKLLNVYTMDVSGKFYSIGPMLFIVLLPLAVLTILSLLFMFFSPAFFFYACMGMLFNLSGSAGDMSMAAYLLLRAKGCKIRDEEYGFSLHREADGIHGVSLQPPETL